MKTHILFFTILAASLSCRKIEPTDQNETQPKKTFKADFRVVTKDSAYQFNADIPLSDAISSDSFKGPEVQDEFIAPTTSNARTTTLPLWAGRYGNEPVNKTITMRWDVDHDLWIRFGKSDSIVAARFAVLFENVRHYYSLIGIKVVLKDLVINHEPELFFNNNIGQALLGYGEKMVLLQRTTHTRSYFTNKNIGGGAYTGQLNTDFALAAIGFGNGTWPTGIEPSYNWCVQIIMHEKGHLFGSKHTHWCNWTNELGQPIGRLDSCFGGEGSCGSNTKWTLNGTTMSYCYNNGNVRFSAGFGPHPRAVIRSWVYNSTIPFDAPQPTLCTSYTYSAWSPCINGTQMRTATGIPSGCVGVAPDLTRTCEMVQVKLPIQSYVATGVTHLGNVAARAFDGNSTSNDNRWVTAGATSTMTMNMANRHCKQLRLWTGFLSGTTWNTPIRSVKVIADGTEIGTYPGSLFFQLDLNRNIQSLRLEFTGDSHVRIREIEVWGW